MALEPAEKIKYKQPKSTNFPRRFVSMIIENAESSNKKFIHFRHTLKGKKPNDTIDK